MNNHLASLKVENLENIQNIEGTINSIEEFLDSANKFHELQLIPDSLAATEDMLRSLLIWVAPFNLYKAQWEVLKSSGLLSNIRGAEIQYQIPVVYENKIGALMQRQTGIEAYESNVLIPFYVHERAGREVRLKDREKIRSDEVYVLIRTYATHYWGFRIRLLETLAEAQRLDQLLGK